MIPILNDSVVLDLMRLWTTSKILDDMSIILTWFQSAGENF